jgi:beta-hydroxylase
VNPALAPAWLAAGVWSGSAFWVHRRGRERLSFMRQIADHSTFLAPYNLFVSLSSAVEATPLVDMTRFPELAPLTAAWSTIRDEALELCRSGHIRKSVEHDDLAFNSFYKRDWRRFYLKWYGDFLPSARVLCPETVALVSRIPTIHAAMFTLLAPRSHLVRHRDPFAGCLRYHLGLVTPDPSRCRIAIDGTSYAWRDGEAVLFDATYIHRAENRTEEPRIILFCDVERPLRTRVATAVNRFAIRRVMPATATANVPGEPVGVANRIFRRVYVVRLLAKRLKSRSRPAYYALSYGAKLGALAGVLYLLLR